MIRIFHSIAQSDSYQSLDYFNWSLIPTAFLFSAWTLLTALPPSLVYSYQPGLRLVYGATHASLTLGRPRAVSESLSSYLSASRASGSRGSPVIALYSCRTTSSLERVMASVCIIGSGNWWVEVDVGCRKRIMIKIRTIERYQRGWRSAKSWTWSICTCCRARSSTQM